MNKLILLILGMLILTSCGVEKLNLKSDSFSYRTKVNGEFTDFTDFTDWDSINVKVKIKKIPFTNNRCKFIIYDKSKISLRAVSSMVEVQEMGEEFISFDCVDSRGEKCRLILLDRGESICAIIYYDSLTLRYNIIEVK